MKETWYHYKCAAGHDWTTQEPETHCPYGDELTLQFKERVPIGYYLRSRERELKCDLCGEVATLLIQNGVETVACTVPDCNGQMHKVISAPHLHVADLAMGESATSAAIDKWQKQRAEKQKIEERTIKEHGSL